MSPVPMITRVRLKNYRSIAECDVQLGPLTILVGPNGSGKSNFLDALHFLADAQNLALGGAIRRRGGVPSVLSRWTLGQPDASFGFEIDLEVSESRAANYKLDVRPGPGTAFEVIHEECIVTEKSASRCVARYAAVENGTSPGRTITVKAPGPQLRPPEQHDPLPGRALLLGTMTDVPEFEAVYDALRNMSFYNLDVSNLSGPRDPDPGERLAPDGSNLPSVLARMSPENKHGWSPGKHVAEWLGVFTPGIEDVRALNIEGYDAVQFEQRFEESGPLFTFRSGEMSDGTLRVLGVLVALYQGSMQGGSPVTLVGIEEPESAVHPAIAVALLEAMDEASLTTQVLATTHSPSMLEQDDIGLDVIRAVKLERGRSVIGPIDAVNRRILADHLYTGGELLRMGHLNPANPADDSAQSEPIASSR